MGQLLIGEICPPQIYLGTAAVNKVMCGTEQVWPIHDAVIYMQVVNEEGKVLVAKTKCVLHVNGKIDNLPSQLGTGSFGDAVVVAPAPQYFPEMECKTAEITQPEGTRYIYYNHDDGTGRVFVKDGVFELKDYEATIVWVMKYTIPYQKIGLKITQRADPRNSRWYGLSLTVGETPSYLDYFTTAWEGTNLVIYLNPILSGDTYLSHSKTVDSTIQCGYDTTAKAFKIVIPRTAFEEGHLTGNEITVLYNPAGDGTIKFTFKEDLYTKSGTRWGWRYTEHCTVTKDGILSTEHDDAPLKAYRSGNNVKVEFGYVSGYSLSYTFSQMPEGATRSGDVWLIPRTAFDSWYPEITVTRTGNEI